MSVINMAWIASVFSVAASCLVTPFLMFMLCIIFLASIGKSLGVRRLYVKILLMIFEVLKELTAWATNHYIPQYGRAEVAENRNKILNTEPDSSDDEETISNNTTELRKKSEPHIVTQKDDTKQANGSIHHSNNLITRNDLILGPDPSLNVKLMQNNHVSKKEASPQKENEETETTEPILEKDFNLSHCLIYVKAGVEAIIEDQVTSRFEAEELKNWNLLTRTNRHYEFISWKLTIIWMCGFFIRYFFLFPLRVLICFIGVVWMVISTFVIGCLPDSSFKRWINKRAFVMTFRILARSLSIVITFHNREYMPNKGGVCVANHTTPIDVMFLSTESCFSLVMWLTLCTALVGYVPDGDFKSWLNRNVSIMCFGVLSSALSSVITYHNSENRPKNGICVANHTSPIDVLVLMCDNCYSLIGQRHGGFLGILQRALARASPHIWFERSEVKDRHAVANRLKSHVSNPKNPPILIFPEGTCINNTSVMQFKKGSFEVGSVIYPVAIKYDPKFGDAFWNSSKYSMMQYLYMMMTSWAIVCDVWYLPPMYQQEGESAIDFANRVKGVIAKQGGLVDLMWDGQLKRMKPKKEWKEKQQEEFSKLLKMD